MRKLILMMLLAAASGSAMAEIYKSVDSAGHVTYSPTSSVGSILLGQLNFATCDKASAWKQYYKLMGVTTQEDWFSCNPDAHETTNPYLMDRSEKLGAMMPIITPIATSAGWTYFANDEHGIIYYISSNTKHRSNGITSAWFFWSLSDPEASATQYVSMRSRKDQFYFNCTDGTMVTNQLIGYEDFDGGGRTLQSWAAAPGALHYTDVVPGSIGEMMLNLVCKTPKASKAHSQSSKEKTMM